MPKLWTDTIQAHRRVVRDAVLDTTAELVERDGLLSVTMTKIAEAAVIGRATLYKYFPDVEAILQAWHEREIAGHIEHLADVAERTAHPGRRLEVVVEAHALMSYERHGSELAAVLQHGQAVAGAQQQLHAFLTGVLSDAADTGDVRDDIAATELANYVLHALSAAATLASKAAVKRLVQVTLDGIRT